jgi:type 1 glutamine amidotransferase
MDFVRRELLAALADVPQLKVGVHSDYESLRSLETSDFLISYTCNVPVSERAQRLLRDWVARGGRWFALHATNALLEWTAEGVRSAGGSPTLFSLLGSEFIAHPPYGAFEVTNVMPDHPLVRDIPPFGVVDELYLARQHASLEVLLATEFGGETPAFVPRDWPLESRPVMYIRHLERGAVLYLTLGHRRGHYDAPHKAPYLPDVQIGPWEDPLFRELIRRGILWSVGLPIAG